MGPSAGGPSPLSPQRTGRDERHQETVVATATLPSRPVWPPDRLDVLVRGVPEQYVWMPRHKERVMDAGYGGFILGLWCGVGVVVATLFLAGAFR